MNLIRTKILTDVAWKDVIAKNKAVKDNGLLKRLGDLSKVGDDEHEKTQKILDEILKLTAQLRKDKAVGAVATATKVLGELQSAVETAARASAKLAIDTQKAEKARADEEKKKLVKGGGEEDDDEDDASSALLTTKMIPLLRLVNKGELMHCLIATAGKQCAVMLSRKPISPARRKILAAELGDVGAIKYITGHVEREEGATTFILKSQVAGMAKRLKLALMQQTGLRLQKLRCRGEEGDSDEDDDGEDRAAVGRGRDGEDAIAREPARPDGGDGDPNAIERALRPSPALERAPKVWEGTRALMERRIDALRDAVRKQVADQDSELVEEIDGHLAAIDRILDNLDRRLADTLANAGAIPDAAGRKEALREAKRILAEYIRYVGSEPLITHLDANPFGVKTDLRVMLMTSLTQLAKTLG